ncbi:peptidoglycan bridge formation glycyltransferase FemA/FemB family protein [Leucobacter sp. CSA1]|uniref:Peptidoglycan bridge formation glycyltransferase FemA/FemB family protein n=1 Tax=Leucobacter chromiisoli TaxID=2796471 RepID=A0A934Q6Q9_9MICO|nr:peptidoglycan bridge formation glycyltransferase FemA/FemB family protein [Leucobacter chromiisoli]MBK0419340.1 peptidoglycan bridge formation glycyltransferase FemA/FemB family protein [Leucobacter chromiisoli]
MGHFLQSEAWARLQRAQDREVVRLEGDGWRVQAFVERGRLNSRLYAPYGPQLDRPEALRPALDALRAEARRLGAAFIRVEPVLAQAPGPDDQPGLPPALLEAAGLRRVARVQPEHTQRVDLSRPFDEVLKGMRKTNRNLHRNFGKKGLSVRSSGDPADIEHLLRLLREVSDRTGMHAHADAYLRTQAQTLVPGGDARIYLVELDGEELPIAASLVYDDEERRYYGHAAASTAHRNLSPGVILVTSMMQEAHEAGLGEFDLYGVVPPEVTDHAWSGFSDFKRSFGGRQVDYSGTWELGVRPLSYAVYSLARRFVGDRA